MNCEECNEPAGFTLALVTGRSSWVFYCWKCLVQALAAWADNPDIEGYEVRAVDMGLMPVDIFGAWLNGEPAVSA